jgi:hypothetical protein
LFELLFYAIHFFANTFFVHRCHGLYYNTGFFDPLRWPVLDELDASQQFIDLVGMDLLLPLSSLFFRLPKV